MVQGFRRVQGINRVFRYVRGFQVWRRYFVRYVFGQVLVLGGGVRVISERRGPIFTGAYANFLHRSSTQELEDVRGRLGTSHGRGFFSIFRAIGISSYTCFGVGITVSISGHVSVLFVLVVTNERIGGGSLIGSAIIMWLTRSVGVHVCQHGVNRKSCYVAVFWVGHHSGIFLFRMLRASFH